MSIKKYIVTARTALHGKTNGGLVYMFPQIMLKMVYLVPLLFLWRVIIGSNESSADMTLDQLLSYTYMSALLGNILLVRTFLTDWDFGHKSTALFSRPMSVFGQVISRTVGEWIPGLLMFSLPMFLIAPLFGINVVPETHWFLLSLILCASLGFAMEFVFFCVTLRLRNTAWLTMVIRAAVVSFFSGAVIPFRLLPFGLDRWMAYQPFGSLGGAPLSLYVGTAEPFEVIIVQLFWNVAFWIFAAWWFRQSRERMVSFGG